MTGKAAAKPAVLDVDDGIARLMGNSGIYFKALKRFTAHIEAARAVAAQLADGDHARAYLTMHTLKGAAGLLGAGEVQAMACQVEAALSSGRAVHPLLNDLDSALQRLQGCIDAALAMPVPENTTAPAAAAIPPATAIRNVPALLDQVGLLLGESNGAAIDGGGAGLQFRLCAGGAARRPFNSIARNSVALNSIALNSIALNTIALNRPGRMGP
jgi:HPt (histidine-containing phosphotransfer) domain-containing protein